MPREARAVVTSCKQGQCSGKMKGSLARSPRVTACQRGIKLLLVEKSEQLVPRAINYLDWHSGVISPESTQQFGNMAAEKQLQYANSQGLSIGNRFDLRLHGIA